jgi:hypothetical protein
MDKLLKVIKDNRDVRQTTLDEYKRSLNTLSNAITGKKYENNDFILKRKDDIEKLLKEKSNSLQKKYLSGVLVALSPKGKNQPEEKNKKIYSEYLSLLNNQNQEYLNKISNNNKSEKDIQKWTDWNSILNVNKSLKRELNAKGIKMSNPETKNKKQLFLLQDYLISSLYTMLPPRRLDYGNALIISKNDYDRLKQKDKDDNVYLVDEKKNKKFFSFGKNAVKSETVNNVIIETPKELNTVINAWLKVNDTKYLLINKKGEIMGKNALSKQLTNIFEPTGKKLSVVMLRKIYLSDKFGDIRKEMKETAEEMNHSTGTQQNIYVKN